MKPDASATFTGSRGTPESAGASAEATRSLRPAVDWLTSELPPPLEGRSLLPHHPTMPTPRQPRSKEEVVGGAPQATTGGSHPALLKSAKECSGAAGGLSFHLSAPETPSVRAGWSTPKLDI
ncbi:hypothetical protein B9Q09_04540 [Candidatus Marsarchaeota G2 archaeon ECH_B_SAG-C16]|uniref:Uncharacterized protein n=1 Tax=Candidatus Marsarchaeota G2 archaeon ECH_B_SAG-C16 TaxID=1978163 RepID=A0A2R6B683_9ARCH|nr:MAG: hypothetical protein B9Q09_04540 [Candidatus Marsarchaeota G2 archaeon ECH_B_SAG-C16]